MSFTQMQNIIIKADSFEQSILFHRIVESSNIQMGYAKVIYHS